MDFSEVRRLILLAIASDEQLVDLLVLKGGNALELVHRIGDRASLDLDFSIEGDVADSNELGQKIRTALSSRLDASGLHVFDFQFSPRPSTAREGARWGGYKATFKLLPNSHSALRAGNHEQMRREAIESGPAHQRIFTIDISKFEYCRDKIPAEIDFMTCYVYTPDMIAAEKLRAICQQMPEYSQRKNPSPRPRDFYDIHAVVTHAGVRLNSPENEKLLANIFRAKDVPVALLRLIPTQQAFHEQEWPAVRDSVRGHLEPFQFYFDFVCKEIEQLHSIRVE